MPRGTSEEHVAPLTNSLDGFAELKVYLGKGLAFVRFENEDQAAAAIGELGSQEAMLAGTTTHPKGVTVEFARRSLRP